MTKYITSLAALLLAVASCAKQTNIDAPGTDAREEGKNLSLSRECFVKSTLDANMAKWTVGDQVAVYQNENETPKRFIAAENGTLAKFSLQEGETALDATGNYFLVYPFSSVGDSKLTSNSVSLDIPAEQTAVPSSFDPAAAVAVAQGSDYKDAFVFKNAHALFKVTIPDAFGAEIAQIRLSSNNEDEKIAGICTVAFNEQIPVITAGEGAVAKVVLSGKDGAVLTPGDYYIATAPVTVSNGICAELIGIDGRVYFRYSTKEKEFKRNTIYDLGVTVQKAGTDIMLDSKYYTEGKTYVYGGRENLFPATVSGVSNAALHPFPKDGMQGLRAMLSLWFLQQTQRQVFMKSSCWPMLKVQERRYIHSNSNMPRLLSCSMILTVLTLTTAIGSVTMRDTRRSGTGSRPEMPHNLLWLTASSS